MLRTESELVDFLHWQASYVRDDGLGRLAVRLETRAAMLVLEQRDREALRAQTRWGTSAV